ncbi:MAG: hypothetical protein IPJ13_21385 [Saprospiraceae bacterium]|nr:hypothetical protein [Saprospiraceae bacterium]
MLIIFHDNSQKIRLNFCLSRWKKNFWAGKIFGGGGGEKEKKKKDKKKIFLGAKKIKKVSRRPLLIDFDCLININYCTNIKVFLKFPKQK